MCSKLPFDRHVEFLRPYVSPFRSPKKRGNHAFLELSNSTYQMCPKRTFEWLFGSLRPWGMGIVTVFRNLKRSLVERWEDFSLRITKAFVN